MFHFNDIEYDSIILHNLKKYLINKNLMCLQSKYFKRNFDYSYNVLTLNSHFKENLFYLFIKKLHGKDIEIKEIDLPDFIEICSLFQCDKLLLQYNKKIDPLIMLLNFNKNKLNINCEEFELEISKNLINYLNNPNFYDLNFSNINRILLLNEKVLNSEIIFKFINNYIKKNNFGALLILSQFDFSNFKIEDIVLFKDLSFILKNSIFEYFISTNINLLEKIKELNTINLKNEEIIKELKVMNSNYNSKIK